MVLTTFLGRNCAEFQCLACITSKEAIVPVESSIHSELGSFCLSLHSDGFQYFAFRFETHCRFTFVLINHGSHLKDSSPVREIGRRSRRALIQNKNDAIVSY
jgi:hypothetical protein